MRQGQYQVLILKEEARQVEVLQEGRQVGVVQMVGCQRAGPCPKILQVHIREVVSEKVIQMSRPWEERPAPTHQSHRCWVDDHQNHQHHQSKQRHQSPEGYVKLPAQT